MQEIAALFPGPSVVEMRETATKDFVLGAASSASHLHLACHAGAYIDSREKTTFYVGADELTITDIVNAGGLQCRLAVGSACQTGLTELFQYGDESLSLGSALVAAGSAGAIVSLWSVNDLSTALLMTRFYELLFENGEDVQAALKASQVWLRTLSDRDLDAYVSVHAELASEVRRRSSMSTAGDKSPIRRPGSAPFSEPEHWAAFVLIGE